jgi:hypothetical protein
MATKDAKELRESIITWRYTSRLTYTRLHKKRYAALFDLSSVFDLLESRFIS